MSLVIACPSCGMRLEVAEDFLGRPVRCATCGHTFQADRPDREYEDEEDDEWGGRRRDYEPHRGSLILSCGIISIVCAPLALVCCMAFSVVGLVLGILAVAWGSADLKAMRADRLDPAGEGATNAGRICGLVGLILNALALLLLVGILIFYGAMFYTGGLK